MGKAKSRDTATVRNNVIALLSSLGCSLRDVGAVVGMSQEGVRRVVRKSKSK